ncbi:hypothetical protein M0D69_14045 [Caballeronia sp. SEWSISQ10-4 2]|uniref:hypothetical protein n=1 Tax=Caballeronia sp. SEWSISQ10-4 2 TaxID=2937438 RepID=UPI0026510FB1|nr:hypothetical protein [Caballeronia sp. SEWSISQ10-4 2]MDN7179116.1 hypothetical protein [Caballeronia sp. SEWSISQ10-4 2]
MAINGIGIGAFMQGIGQGMQLGRAYKQAKDEYDDQQITKDAMAEARAQQAQLQDAESQRLQGSQGLPAQTQPTPQQPLSPTDPNGVQTAPVSLDQPQATALPGGAPATPAPMPQQKQAPQPQPAAALAPNEQQIAAAGAPAANPSAQGLAPGAMAPTVAPMEKAAADKQAVQSVPTVMKIFREQGVPKIAEAFLAKGDAAKASAWTKWAEEERSQDTMKTWTKMWRASQTGDFKGMADHALNLFNQLDDGTEATKHEVVKNNDGDITGFNVTLRDKKTGEDRSAFVGKEQLLDMGLSALSPTAQFDAVYKKQQTIDANRAKAVEKAGEMALKFKQDVALEGVKQGGRVQIEGIKGDQEMDRDVARSTLKRGENRAEARDKIDVKVEALQKAGHSQEFIDRMMPEIVGAGDLKKRTAPEEAKRMMMGDLMKSDPTFAYKSIDEKRKIVDEHYGMIYPNGSDDSGPAADGKSVSGKVDNMFSGNSNPAKKGIPMLDTKTGKVVYR